MRADPHFAVDAARGTDAAERLLGAQGVLDEIDQGRRVARDQVRRNGVEAFPDRVDSGLPGSQPLGLQRCEGLVELGLVLGLGAVGGLVGASATTWIDRRIGIGRTFMLGCILFPAPLLLVPLATGSHTVVLGCLLLAEFGSALGVLILDISIGSIFATVIPDHLRARVSGAYRTVNYGIRPLGALTGGALGSTIGLRATLWIAAIGGLTGILWLIGSPLPKLKTLTSEDQERGTGR